jgi:hypothetical protein
LIDWLSLGVIGVAAILLASLSRSRRPRQVDLRVVPALTRLYRAFGLSVEDGTRLLVSLGGQSLLTGHAGAALAGLSLLREVSHKASVSDRPPVAVAGDPGLALLAQDTMQAGYRAVGSGEYYQPVTGRLAGLTPFSAAAATMQIMSDEDVSVAALIGHFGPEAGLLSEAADRANAVLIGATGDASAQSVLFATTPEALIGEELFAAPVYLAGGSAASAALAVHDVIRWLIIAGLVLGAGLKILGIF